MMQSRREGFALAATVLAMLVVGAIVTGGFYAASQEGQVARSTRSADDAMFIAEAGSSTTLAQASAPVLSQMAMNSTVTGSATNVTVGTTVLGNYVASITRVAEYLFVINSTATVTRGGRYAGATHRVSTMMRMRTADFSNEAAIVNYGDLSIGGNSEVDGTDFYPTDWTGQGCTLNTSASAVITNPSTVITVTNSATITGPVTRDSLTADDFTVFGDLTWYDLVGMAEKFPSGTVDPNPVVSAGVCQTSNAMNWGSASSTNPCFNYFPIIYSSGTLHISSSGEGQGILLVDGDLDISGGFNFYGVAIVMGEIRMPGTGGHINGTTMAWGGGDIDSSNVTRGNSLLQYSSCAIHRAVINNSSLTRLTPIANRSWMDVSAISGGN